MNGVPGNDAPDIISSSKYNFTTKNKDGILFGR